MGSADGKLEARDDDGVNLTAFLRVLPPVKALFCTTLVNTLSTTKPESTSLGIRVSQQRENSLTCY